MLESLFLVPATWAEWKDWFKHDAPGLAGVVIGLALALIVFRTVINRLLHSAIASAARVRIEDRAAVERRTRTLIATLNWLFTIFLVFLGSALVLDNLGLNVSALIAGVGIVGITLGLGTQTLIKDVINGTFIVVEDQYAVGDIVTVAGITGEVVAINPRRTVLRDGDGAIHTIPNSAISVATNFTQGFSRINLDLSVPAGQDAERVMAVIDEVGLALAKERPADVINAPHVLRINAIRDTSVELKIVGDVKAGKQWELSGELRRRLLVRFAEAGIQIPGLPPLPSASPGRSP
jgi:small-conductance mechanosensitive channel